MNYTSEVPNSPGYYRALFNPADEDPAEDPWVVELCIDGESGEKEVYIIGFDGPNDPNDFLWGKKIDV